MMDIRSDRVTLQNPRYYDPYIRSDPVKLRVGLPAANPPDNAHYTANKPRSMNLRCCASMRIILHETYKCFLTRMAL